MTKLKVPLTAALLIVLLSACTTAPDGSQQLTPEGQAIMETSARIAMRHFISDSPRAAERAQNVREVIAKIQAVTSAETTLGALKAVVVAEVERLNLAPVDKADALDLLELFAVSLESRLGDDPLQARGLVRVNAFLGFILGLLPPGE